MRRVQECEHRKVKELRSFPHDEGVDSSRLLANKRDSQRERNVDRRNRVEDVYMEQCMHGATIKS